MSSTRHIYKTTNVKFRNIALSYSLPERFVKPLGITSCNLHLIGDNLLVWTPHDKKDRNSYKQSMSGYPIETSFSLGVDLSF